MKRTFRRSAFLIFLIFLSFLISADLPLAFAQQAPANNSAEEEIVIPPNDLAYVFAQGSNLLPNTRTNFNAEIDKPKIDPAAFVHPQTMVVGNVSIAPGVYVAAQGSIRGDEGQPIFIDEGSVVWEGVSFHALETEISRVPVETHLRQVGTEKYAIYVGKNTVIAPRCSIHGPALIGQKVFLGANSLIFNSNLGDNCIIGEACQILNISIPAGKIIPPRTVVNTDADVAKLENVPNDDPRIAWRDNSLRVGKELVGSYNHYLAPLLAAKSESEAKGKKTSEAAEASSTGEISEKLLFKNVFAGVPTSNYPSSDSIAGNNGNSLTEPKITERTYIHPAATVIGNIEIGSDTMVDPTAAIISDEGEPIKIGNTCAIQDGAVIHGSFATLKENKLEYPTYSVEVKTESKEKKKKEEIQKKLYNIIIGDEVTVAHQAVILGPAKIGDSIYIGQRAFISNSTISDGVVIEPYAVIMNVTIQPGSYVPAGWKIFSQDTADKALKSKVCDANYCYSNIILNSAEANVELVDAYLKADLIWKNPFISKNVKTGRNPSVDEPVIDLTSFIFNQATIIGDVIIGKEDLICPGTSIRSDQGNTIYIGDQTGIQDCVIINDSREVRDEKFKVYGGQYGIYIGQQVTISHGALIQAPVVVMDGTYVGQNALIIDAQINPDCIIEPGAAVIGVLIPEKTLVPSGRIINDAADIPNLPKIDPSQTFAASNQEEVSKTLALSASYNGIVLPSEDEQKTIKKEEGTSFWQLIREGGPLLKFFYRGGPFMWPILFCSLLALTVVFERTYTYRKIRLNPNFFVNELQQILDDEEIPDPQERISKALEYVQNINSPLAALVKTGLAKFGYPEHEIERAIESTGTVEVHRLEKGLMALASVSNLAPLLGFLGTVVGIILAFEVIASQGLADPSLVGKGISMALIMTAFGLFVAIPTLGFYNYFATKISKFVTDMHLVAYFLLTELPRLAGQKEE